jgi:hypothetical protein
LDPLIKSIPRNINRFIIPGTFFEEESNRETDKNESLADDNTSITLMEEESLTQTKVNLELFANLSGLHCNFNKTCIMTTYEPDQVTIELATNLNFTLTDRFTLLGVEITRDLDNTEAIFEKIKNKIIGLASFWERFRLSLPGRITVAKTFLVSQLSYVACFLTPSDRIINEIQSILDNFVRKNMNISRERMHLEPATGGIGMFDINNFFCSQKCSWIFRAHKNTIDNWRYDLASSAPNNNILLIRPTDVPVGDHPILHNIAKSYQIFYSAFSAKDNNYKTSVIFDNNIFTVPPTFVTNVDVDFFGRNFYEENKELIRRLTYIDCFMNNQYRTIDQFRAIGLNLSAATWMRLRAVLFRARDRLNALPRDARSQSINEYVQRYKKGSKLTRKIIEQVRTTIHVRELRHVNTFFDLIQLPVPDAIVVKKLNITWNLSYLSSSIKDFIFKIRSNYLKLNNRLNAYNENIDPKCTFCRIRIGDAAPRDSLEHCFLSCPTSGNAINALTREFFANYNIINFREFFWTGILDGHEKLMEVFVVFWDVFRYLLFKFRLRRKIPNIDMLRKELVFALRTSAFKNRQFSALANSEVNLAQLQRAIG